VKLLRFLLVLVLLCSLLLPAAADTGTYKILRYTVTLTPHSDGKVDLDYYQQWQVTGGNIPWITVGLPNSDFEITKSGNAVRSINPANEGSWSGVRIDLDRAYQPNQTFEVSFSVSQNRLFYADDTNYKLDFTPGWYDRAPIESLEIRLKSFAKVESITANPQPTSTSEDLLTWEKTGMGEGEQFAISISFPKALIPNSISDDNLTTKPGIGTRGLPQGNYDGSGSSPVNSIFGDIFFWTIVGLVILGWLGRISRRHRSKLGHYTGGNVFWGSLIDAFLSGTDSDDSRGGRHTGGGGGFGGGGFSCACACVSCACACACAGGGGAGCSRKTAHTCPVCEKRLRHEN
jgi:hypothetical protein